MINPRFACQINNKGKIDYHINLQGGNLSQLCILLTMAEVTKQKILQLIGDINPGLVVTKK